MVTELPARRDLCDEKLRQATLVDFRGSSLSDPGSIPGISTNVLPQGGTFCYKEQHEENSFIWISHHHLSLSTGDTHTRAFTLLNFNTSSFADSCYSFPCAFSHLRAFSD